MLNVLTCDELCVDMAITWHVVGYIVDMLCHNLAYRIKCVVT